MNSVLRIAIQKSGRLQEDSLKLLKESGLQFSNGRDQLKAQVRNFPVELLFLRDDDIPQYVEDRVAIRRRPCGRCRHCRRKHLG